MELLGGQLVVMSPMGTRHCVAVDRVTRAMIRLAGDTAIVRTQGTVVPESFTHGTSAQRVNWFKRGVEGGSIDRCNTFEGRDL